MERGCLSWRQTVGSCAEGSYRPGWRMPFRLSPLLVRPSSFHSFERLQYIFSDDGKVTHLSVAGFLGLSRCYGDSSRRIFPFTFRYEMDRQVPRHV